MYAFDLWLGRRGTSGSLDLKQALERIQSLFEKSSDARFDVLGSDTLRQPVSNRLGWVKGNGDNRRWHMLPETFQKEICAGFDAPTLISELVKDGVLEGQDMERRGVGLRKSSCGRDFDRGVTASRRRCFRLQRTATDEVEHD